MFLKTAANGFSARAEPSAMETFAARTARGLAMPANAKNRTNPVSNTQDVLAEARAHWADHCAGCHANDGSGQVEMGKRMYPPAPDMRKEPTQKMSDGELFFIIENGIRLSGMPAWGGSEAGGEDSWKLVHFIRHLPTMSATEMKEMEEEKQEEQFLKGNPVSEAWTCPFLRTGWRFWGTSGPGRPAKPFIRLGPWPAPQIAEKDDIEYAGP